MQALAMTVAEIPVFLYSTFGQVPSTTQHTSVYLITGLSAAPYTQTRSLLTLQLYTHGEK